jgi:hypothetical protein
MPNNQDLVPISINISSQQFIVVIANIPPTINALAFADPMGISFNFLSWIFSQEF